MTNDGTSTKWNPNNFHHAKTTGNLAELIRNLVLSAVPATQRKDRLNSPESDAHRID